jgi:ATP-dependent helicase HrpA
MDQIAYSAIMALMVFQQPIIRNKTDFEIRLIKNQNNFLLLIQKIMNIYFEMVEYYIQVKSLLEKKALAECQMSIEDIKKQVETLFVPNFISLTPLNWLVRYPIYLKTMIKRLNALPQFKNRDELELKQIYPLLQAYYIMSKKIAEKKQVQIHLVEFKWMIEEFRVSLYAQELKTLYPISQKRLISYWQKNIQQGGSSLIELMMALFILTFVTMGGIKLLLNLNHNLPDTTTELVEFLSKNDDR